MPNDQDAAGQVVALYRYPVKSMQGEQLSSSEVTRMGLFGDRIYALVDRADGRVGTARNSRKWPGLFQFNAALIQEGSKGRGIPPVKISLPDGSTTSNEDEACDTILSAAFGRQVTLRSVRDVQGRLMADGEDQPAGQQSGANAAASGFRMPEGSFFDAAVVHLLTTASLGMLSELYPTGRIEPRRFRPNILVDAGDGLAGFIENEWIGRKVAIGKELRLRITGFCGRCVMTTLPQGDLPADPGILKTISQNNESRFGVYAEVLEPGTVRNGDSIWVV